VTLTLINNGRRLIALISTMAQNRIISAVNLSRLSPFSNQRSPLISCHVSPSVRKSKPRSRQLSTSSQVKSSSIY